MIDLLSQKNEKWLIEPFAKMWPKGLIRLVSIIVMEIVPTHWGKKMMDT